MILQNKLVLLSVMLSTVSMIGCDDDSNSCSLTEAMCVSANRVLDVDRCECIDTNESTTCPLTQAMCVSVNKVLDADKCECIDTNAPTTCPLTQAMCVSANKVLDADKCECIDTNTPTTCPTGKHVFGNNCEDDSLENCGIHGYNCTTAVDGWKAGVCLNGACQATACEKGFHVYNHACEGDSLENCGSHNIACNQTITGWSTGSCVEGKCQLDSCKEGYHAESNECVPNPLSPGDIITFGHYEQDGNITNGKEPITWRVLKKMEDQYLIISEKTLDARPYNATRISVTWQTCTLRSWLNGFGASYNANEKNYTTNNFIDEAFTAEERSKIVSVTNNNPDTLYGGSGGNKTVDKIFLLTSYEANTYFTDENDRRASATPYAINRGALYNEEDNVSSWWLRSPGTSSTTNSSNMLAAYVNREGEINTTGIRVEVESLAVRPALWVIFN